MAVSHTLLHFYRSARAWQMRCASECHPGDYDTDDRFAPADGMARFQLSHGGAAYQNHAVAAIQSARGQISFRKRLSDDVRADKRRSAAALKGWRTRRANAA